MTLVLILFISFFTLPTYADETSSNDRIWVTGIKVENDGSGFPSSQSFTKPNGGYIYRGTLYKYHSYILVNGKKQFIFKDGYIIQE